MNLFHLFHIIQTRQLFTLQFSPIYLVIQHFSNMEPAIDAIFRSNLFHLFAKRTWTMELKLIVSHIDML